MKSNIKIIISMLIVVIWMIVIYDFSNMPTDESNNMSKSLVNQIVRQAENINNEVKKEQNIDKKDIDGQEERQKSKKEKTKILIEKLNMPIRKCAHASVYFVLAIFMMILLYQVDKKKYKLYSVICIILCFLYACTDEYHQTFVLGRTGQFTDVLIDTAGAILGVILFRCIIKLLHKYNKEKEVQITIK